MSNRKKLLTLFALAAISANAQKIDFNLYGKENISTSDGYTSWAVKRQQGAQSITVDSVTITVETATGDRIEGNGCNNNWWKDGVNKYDKLISDAVYPVILDASNNYSPSTTKAMGLKFTISGLKAGEHSLCAYHNNTDGILTPGYPPITVLVNGEVKQEGVEQTIRAQKVENAGMSYVKFTAEEGKDVVVEYITEPDNGVSYINNYLAVNALIFDHPNPKTQAVCISPEDRDYHADCDLGPATLSWTGGSSAVAHRVMFGTDPENLQQVQESADLTYKTGKLSSLNIYYWRIDEIDAEGKVYEGDVWAFCPRHLAFPGAEGYGRYARGGRGGLVYHVTSLDDDVNDPQPGTFRYGITKIHDPRTIVFDVCGYIHLQGRLTCADRYVTIAGQTAPGEGITFRGAPLGVATDGITRFIRSYRGYAGTTAGPDETEQNKGLDGLGMAGCNNAIVDHCSISWTTDEGFSSRNAKSITLQHTMISEALNCADHPNYESGTCHGFAATIGGGQGSGVGSFHHNLLAHCEGRNWSISGGLDGSGNYDGAHDIFNNVVYNWGGRATDGGSHEINFVNNYYKMGPATTRSYFLNLQLEGTGTGTQSAYVKGNIRQAVNGVKTGEVLNTTYKYTLSGGQVLDWTPFVTTPFFESYATIETAEAAFANVLSDVGCNEPFLNQHDTRMVTETFNGTTSTVGSKTGKKGLIDREWDNGCEGYLTIEEIHRDADFDTDQDGMPDWWEKLNATNPDVADNNMDMDGVGTTALEDYLNWCALPHFDVEPGATLTIDLQKYFAGYPVSGTTYTLLDAPASATLTGSTLSYEAGSDDYTAYMYVQAKNGDVSLVRQFNIHCDASATGVHTLKAEVKSVDDNYYNLSGQKVNASYPGVKIHNGKKTVGN